MSKLESIQLITGVTILAEVTKNEDTYTLKNPIRPIILDGRIVYSRLNPYSDEKVVDIHKSHVIYSMPMHTAYIDVYMDAVEKTEQQLRQVLEALQENVGEPDKIIMDVQGGLQ